MDIFLVLFSTFITLVFGFLRYKYSYWELQGVDQLKTNFLFGTFFKINSIHHQSLLHEVYQQFKGKAKLAGTYLFTKPIAVILDLDLVKLILVKDFNKFVDRSEYADNKNDKLMSLFVMQGEKWRNLRSKLTPTFTSGKMKFMFPTIVNVSKKFEEAFTLEVNESPDSNIDLHDINARFTTDVIGACVIGVECNSLKDPSNRFRQIGGAIFFRKFFSIRWRIFQDTYFKLFKYLGFKRFSNEILSFLRSVVNKTVKEREEKKIQRNDFMNILIELKNTKDENGRPILSLDDLVAQVFLFFSAGFETSSSNMTFALYELAKNPDVQEKLRAEILNTLEIHNGELTYEAMMEMTFLEQTITETIRKYPALASLTRVAREDYPIPGTNITIEKGTLIHIPVKEIHYDSDYYEEPLEFRPDRFSAENVKNRHSESFLGFGDGPRNCIGLRFGRMQVRVGLITLLKSFKFSISEKTPDSIKFGATSIVLVPNVKVWLKVEKL